MFKIDVTDLDKLQRTLREARLALESLDGEITRISINFAEPLEVQRAIHRMEVAVDAKIEPYKDNAIVARLAEATKESFRERILQLASSRRSADTGPISLPAGKEQPGMASPIEVKRKQRFEFMNELYKVTNGSEFIHVNMAEVGMSIGLTKEECELTVEYLSGEGLLKYASLGGGIAITHIGVLEVESALQDPAKPTNHFPPAQNIIHIGAMTNSVIQQGSSNSSQVANLGTKDIEFL